MKKNLSITKIGIVSIPDNKQAGSVIEKLRAWSQKNNLELFMEKETAKNYSPQYPGRSISEIADYVDIILLLGGDGTLLRAAHSIKSSHNIPILGINLGSLGFLTEVTVEEMFPTLDYILKNGFSLDERMTLEASVYEDGKKTLKSNALNDIVIDKGNRNILIKLCAHIDDIWVNTFLCDGIIIATPTGSTAYSLSAGGSIVYPDLKCILMTPICPHILTNRPIIIPDSAHIELSIQSKGENAFLSIDGQLKTQLSIANRIIITKSEKVIKLIRAPDRSYYQILRAKFKWGERGVEISKERC
ncbi:MAG: NAD(+)/NADH kinase [bacterium]